jgi:hypothetical protein
MPSDCTPKVLITPVASFVTVTAPELPPFEPAPPSATNRPCCQAAAAADACAKIPRDCAAVVVIVPVFVTRTAPPLPPLSPDWGSETVRFKRRRSARAADALRENAVATNARAISIEVGACLDRAFVRDRDSATAAAETTASGLTDDAPLTAITAIAAHA